ncbi:iron ABC transporter permease [Avibacterium sp. 21-586]|uniref:FecCD family ABC transporter permease n=1 Tax=Avibacterium sp. 21-586 TaxID=2911534 RepID=UPI002247CA6A|nr:iron ABC transporter permease [Avibacterium sp. 21-586]MCW9710285.1 iron ABC transporter permease [Avibacterium sp. 21-586]
MIAQKDKKTVYHTFMLCNIIILCLIIFVSLSVGAIKIALVDLVNALFGRGEDSTVFVLQQLRLPRTLLAMFIGATLATCGTILQGLFRNPLADPGIIGVSAGSALGAGIAIVLLPTGFFLGYGTNLIAIFAFLGGLFATLLVYQVGKTGYGTKMLLILLSGIAIGSLAFAFLGLLQFIADDQALRTLTTWQLGSVANGDRYAVGLSAVVFFIVFYYFYRQSLKLNAMLLGDLEARHLGIDIEKIKKRCIYSVALAIGVSVSIAGMIGFIGLVVPHICRTILGADHRTLLPASALSGAILLLVADVLARVVAAPAEIPIGILTALLGAPFFIGLLIKNKEKL